ncbi:hypothetical protein V1477_019259, partial [Vespula maculifrons]
YSPATITKRNNIHVSMSLPAVKRSWKPPEVAEDDEKEEVVAMPVAKPVVVMVLVVSVSIVLVVVTVVMVLSVVREKSITHADAWAAAVAATAANGGGGNGGGGGSGGSGGVVVAVANTSERRRRTTTTNDEDGRGIFSRTLSSELHKHDRKGVPYVLNIIEKLYGRLSLKLLQITKQSNNFVSSYIKIKMLFAYSESTK